MAMVKVECDGCQAPYSVSEKRIPSGGLKMRCPKCGTSFMVERPDGVASSTHLGGTPQSGHGLAPPGSRPAQGGRTLRSMGAPAPPRSKKPLFARRDPIPVESAAPASSAPPADSKRAPSPFDDLPLPADDLPAPFIGDLPAAVDDLPALAGDDGGGFGVLDLPLPVDPGVTSPHGGMADLPSPSYDDLPLPAADDLPAPLEPDLPSPLDAGLPSPFDAGLPAPLDIGLPAPFDAGLPAPADVGLPAPADVGLPAPADVGLPLPADNLPSPRDHDFPLPPPDPLADELPPPPAMSNDDVDRAFLSGGGFPSETRPEDIGALPQQHGDSGFSADLDSMPPRAPAPPQRDDGIGGEFRVDEGRTEATFDPHAPPSVAAPDDAPRVQLKPKRSKRLPIGLIAVLVIAIGGGALPEPIGPYGWFIISDTMNRAEYEQTLEQTRSDAEVALDADTAAGVEKAIRAAQAKQGDMPRFAPMAYYTSYLVFVHHVRFGGQADLDALGKRLLDQVITPEPGPLADLASAARSAAEGHLDAAHKRAKSAAAKMPGDANAAAFAAELELRVGTPEAALEAWKKAAEAHKSARTLFGLARAQFAVGQHDEARATALEVMKLSKDHAGARALVADVLLRKGGESIEAVKLLEQITAPGPIFKAASTSEKVAAFTMLGEVHLRAGRITNAEASFAEALKLDPQGIKPLIGNGELFFKSERYSEALARFEAALRAEPDNLDAQIGRVKTLLALERVKDARILVKKLATDKATDPRIFYWKGQTHEKQGQRDEAEKAYGKAIEVGDKENAVVLAYVALGSLLGARGQDDAAAKTLDEAGKKFPGNPSLHEARGDVALKSGHLDQAQDEFLVALTLDEKFLSARFKLAVAFSRAHSFTEAQRYFDEVEKIDPNYPGLALEVGVLLEDMGKTDEALAKFEKARELDPNDDDIKLRVASTQVRSGLTDKAKPLLREVRQKRPGSAEVNYFLGRALFQEDPTSEEALRLLRKAVSIDPNRSEYHLYVAWAANEKGELGLAKQHIDAALELDRNNGDAYWQRGVYLQKRGQTIDALEDLRLALDKKPSRAEAHAAMALCFQEQAQWSDAETSWRKAIDGSGNEAEWHYRLGKILVDHHGGRDAAQFLTAATKLTESKKLKSRLGWLPDAYRLLGEALSRTDQRGAIDAYKKFLKLAPKDYAYRDEVERELERLGGR